MLTITDVAAEEISKIIQQENDADLKLRVGVMGGGCSGLNFFLNLDKEHNVDDREMTVNNIQVRVDAKSEHYLDGARIDYIDGPQGTGFTFDNPNIQRSCSCGSSH